MRWNVSMTTAAIRYGDRPWSDIATSVLVEVDLIGALEKVALCRVDDGGLRIDAALDAATAPLAYRAATAAAATALRAAGVGLVGWSTVLVVSRPASWTPGWRPEPDSAARPAEW